MKQSKTPLWKKSILADLSYDAITLWLEEIGENGDPTWDGHYQKNEMLSRWYGWLNALGYSISSDERALVDGTHECFMEE